MRTRRSLVILIAFGLFGLAGCGWEPVYADRETGPADAELRAIRVQPIPERIGQKLAIGLRDWLNPSGEPTPQLYVLRTTLQTARLDLGVLVQGSGTRGRYDAIVNYSLADIRTGAQLFASTSRAAEAFDILANYYANVVAEEDAATRAAEQLRREMATQLTLFLQRRAAEAAGAQAAG